VEWILEAAARLFREHGYTATTTNKVAELAGVSIGSLYQYFPNKDALLVELARRHMDTAAEAVTAEISRAAEERRELPDLLRGLITLVADLHSGDSGLHLLLVGHALRSPGPAAELRAVEERIARALAAELRRAGAAGDTETAALLAVQGIDAQIHGALLAPPPGRSPEEVLEAIIAQWTRALAPPDPAPEGAP